MTTEKTDLSRILLSELGSIPQQLKKEGYAFTVGQLAVNLGNMVLSLSHSLETGPQSYQPLDERPESLFALGKSLREIGLLMWEPEKNKERVSIEREIEFLKTRLARIELKGGAK